MKDSESFYDQFAEDEWDRLDRHRTEFAVTLRALSDYLPPPPITIIDIGGGPGRYSIELSRLGYEVTLVDVSKQCLRVAKEKSEEAGVAINKIIHADAIDLNEIMSGQYKAALLMGPLYHLISEDKRKKSVKEAVRIIEEHGLLFAGFITRFAPFRSAASISPDWPIANEEYAQKLFDTGVHTEGKRMPETYFAHPDEIVTFMENCGLRTLMLIGCEGIVAGHEEKVNDLVGSEWDTWVDLNYRLGKEPSLLGASDHLLYIGEKSS